MSAWNRFKDALYLGPRLVLVVLFMALLLVMALGNFDLLEPYLFPLHMVQGRIVAYGGNITVGHYPQRYQLEKLKRERGIDLDVSLLDPDLPQERVLNAQVAEAAAGLGIAFKSVPLTYLDLDGARNRARIAQLASYLRANRSRKVYIHCYLGRHRVKAVTDELARQGLIRQ